MKFTKIIASLIVGAITIEIPHVSGQGGLRGGPSDKTTLRTKLDQLMIDSNEPSYVANGVPDTATSNSIFKLLVKANEQWNGGTYETLGNMLDIAPNAQNRADASKVLVGTLLYIAVNTKSNPRRPQTQQQRFTAFRANREAWNALFVSPYASKTGSTGQTLMEGTLKLYEANLVVGSRKGSSGVSLVKGVGAKPDKYGPGQTLESFTSDSHYDLHVHSKPPSPKTCAWNAAGVHGHDPITSHDNCKVSRAYDPLWNDFYSNQQVYFQV